MLKWQQVQLTFHLLLFLLVVTRLADVHRDGPVCDGSPVKVDSKANVITVCGELPAHFLGLGDSGDVHRHDVAPVHRHHAVRLRSELRLQLLQRGRCPCCRRLQGRHLGCHRGGTKSNMFTKHNSTSGHHSSGLDKPLNNYRCISLELVLHCNRFMKPLNQSHRWNKAGVVMKRSAGPHFASQWRVDSSQCCCAPRLLPPGPAQQGPPHRYPQSAHTHKTRYYIKLKWDLTSLFIATDFWHLIQHILKHELPLNADLNPPWCPPCQPGRLFGDGSLTDLYSGDWRWKKQQEIKSSVCKGDDIRMQWASAAGRVSPLEQQDEQPDLQQQQVTFPAGWCRTGWLLSRGKTRRRGMTAGTGALMSPPISPWL